MSSPNIRNKISISNARCALCLVETILEASSTLKIKTKFYVIFVQYIPFLMRDDAINIPAVLAIIKNEKKHSENTR